MNFLSDLINISWIVPGVSQILLFIDGLLFAVLDGVIGLVFLVGNFNLTKISEAAENLVYNVQSLVGIYILFKASLLFIQYLIEPDAFKDKAKGGEAFIKSIVVVIILLTLLSSNLLFGFFNDIQKVVFSYGTAANPVEYEVLGTLGITPSDEKTDLVQKIVWGDNQIGNPAHFLTVKIAEQFLFVCDITDIDASECKKSWFDYPKSTDSFWTALSMAVDPSVMLGSIAHSPVGGIAFFGLATIGTGLQALANVQYMAIISTVFAIYMIMKFMKITMQLVMRFFKLFLMQLLSPIAIVSYITPDGKKTFQNFWKTYFTIYMELFLRLFIVYVSIYIMSVVLGNSFTPWFGTGNDIYSSPDFITEMILKVILLIGLSKFMDEMPELVASLFGTKLGDPKQKTMGNILGGILGAGLGFGIGAASAKAAGLTGWGAAANAGLGLFGGAKSGSSAQNVGAFVSGQVANATKSVGRGMDIAKSGGISDYLQLQADKTFGHANEIKKQHSKLTDSAKFHQENASSIKQLDKSFQDDYARTFADLNPSVSWAKNREFDTIRQIAEAESAGNTNFSAVRARLDQHAKDGTVPSAPIEVKDSNGTVIGSYSNLSQIDVGEKTYVDEREKHYKTQARKDGVAYIERYQNGTTSSTYKDEKRSGSASIYAAGEERVQKYNTDYETDEQFVDLSSAKTTLNGGKNYFKIRETNETDAHTNSMNKLREFNSERRNINITSGGGK